jgi:hypothetical protein
VTHRLRRPPLVGPAAAALLLALTLAPSTVAHSGITLGDYLIEAGWREEPPSIGRQNAVQVTITRHDDDQPVIDLSAGDLAVVVETAGSESQRLELVPAFDPGTSQGPLGIYEAGFVPNVVGNTTFHITGSINGTVVNLTMQGAAVEETPQGVEEPQPGLDPALLVGGAALVGLLAAMAFLFFRVRPAPPPPSGRLGPDR